MRRRQIVLVFLILLTVFVGPLGNAVFAVDMNDILDRHVPANDTVPEAKPGLPAITGSIPVETTVAVPPPLPARASGTARFGVAVMSDLHVRQDNLRSLNQAVEAVNNLPGISAVALTGDLCHTVASPNELKLAAGLVGRFADQVWAIPGNHDFMYQDTLNADGKRKRGSAAQKKAKLAKFQSAMRQKALRFSRKVGGHLLVFLPIDALSEKPLACLSAGTLKFFRETLAANPSLPTVVFCHAPLPGSYERETDLGPTHANVQPANTVRDILQDNPQVFLWVAGHLHIKPGSRDFRAKSNKVDGVTGIHLPNVPEGRGWVLTLDLRPAAAVVRTYDVHTRTFLAQHDRTFRHKGTGAAPKADDPQVEPPAKPPTTGGQPTTRPADQKDVLAGLERLLQRLQALLGELLRLVG